MTDKKILECFVEDRADFRLRPAPHQRDWMDNSPDRFAYRCLPLAIANTYGWDVLNPSTFQATWNGGRSLDDITVATKNGTPLTHATSHFGDGVLTFHIPCLFRTPKGYDLFVMGPANSVRPHIQALTGVIETDWSPYTFTMNWKFTSPNEVVTFAENDPIATIFPVRRGEIETFEPVERKPGDDPEFWADFSAWRESRSNFNEDLQKPGSDAQAQKWQKGYMQGPDDPIDPPHRSKLRLRPLKKSGSSDNG